VEKLSFTLYEIFGYFLPGSVGVIATAIMFWAIFLPTSPIPVQSWELSKLWYFGLIVVSYYAGHVLQGMSRWCFSNPNGWVLAKQELDMISVIRQASKQVAAALDLGQSEILASDALVRVCDEAAVQYGQIGDRDVFVYREGFYRGSTAAFVLLDVGLLLRCVISGTAVRLHTRVFPVSCWQLIFIMAVVTFSVFFLGQRYRHFAALRVMRGVLAFVSLSSFRNMGSAANRKQA
jgi:hypothetical protein